MKTFLNQLVSGQASKFLVAVLTTAASALATYFGDAKWEPIAVMVIGAIVTYLVPNTPAEPPQPSIVLKGQ